MKRHILFIIGFIILLTGRSYADSWSMRPDTDFHAHPLYEIAQSSRVCVRAKILKVLRPSKTRSSGLIKVIVISPVARGQVMYAKNYPSSSHVFNESPGLSVIISYIPGSTDAEVFIDSPNRSGILLVIFMLFVALVILVGGRRCLYSLVSLTVFVILIKAVYIPLIINGGDVIAATFILLTAIIVFTVISINGFCWNGLAAVLGSLSALYVLYMLSLFFYSGAHINGFYLEEIQLINFISIELQQEPLSFFRELLIAMSLIGACGVIMDVSITVSSTMREIAAAAPGLSFAELYKSAVRVGSDVVATMSNTLIFAYIGIAMASIITKTLNVSSLFQLGNLESVHVDIYKAFLGSSAYVICVVVTAVSGAYIFQRYLTKK